MLNEEMEMSDLVQKVERLRDTAERMENQIDGVKPDDLDLIRTAYTARLAQEWSALSKTAQPPNTREELQQRIEKLSHFVERFADVVQQPRRAGIAQELNLWLQSWVQQGNVKWQEYLEDATDEQLETTETQLDELEQPGLGDEKIETVVRKWLKYQVKRLNATEKRASHVIGWLERVNQNLVDAHTLVDELLSPILDRTPEEGEHPIITQIRKAWGEQLRACFTEISIEVESLPLDDCLTKNWDKWQTIQSGLTNLGAALATCNEAEIALVQKQVNSWQSVDDTQISELLKAIAELRNIEEWRKQHSSFLDGDITDTITATPEIQKLVENRPSMPSPAKYPSLIKFQTEMKKYKENAEAWLEQCDEVYSDIQGQLENWQDSLLPENIRNKFIQIAENWDDLSSLAQLAKMSRELRNAEEQAQEYVKKSLGPEERTIWENLQSLKKEGKTTVNLYEIDTDEDGINAIAKLAKQGLIRVRIEL